VSRQSPRISLARMSGGYARDRMRTWRWLWLNFKPQSGKRAWLKPRCCASDIISSNLVVRTYMPS